MRTPEVTRRTFGMLLLSAAARAACGQDSAGGSRDSRGLLEPDALAAIDRGLAWLAARQQEDGTFGTVGAYRSNPGVAALCGLAFLSSGSTPGRGPYGGVIDKNLDYILSCAQPSGYIVDATTDYYHGPMYGHGFATLFLAEVCGMSEREELSEALRQAVRLIVDSQNDAGGWRYTPDTKEEDLSVTVCQAMALRAARNAGVEVPKETIDRCVAYIEKCQNPDGGFRYQLREAPDSEFARSAAAIVALHTSGAGSKPAVARGVQYMLQYVPGAISSPHQKYYYYAQYYAVQAAWHAGEDVWNRWFPAARDELLSLQLTDGSWSDLWIGNEYASAMALIVLQMPNNFLPIFER